jgi:hypothetical protein
MKKVALLRIALLVLLLLVPVAGLAQLAPDEVVPDDPAMVTPIEALAKAALIYLGLAATIFATIQGLKNSFPPLAALFLKFPSLGLILNVVAALVTQIILCLKMDPFNLLEVGKCLLTAFYQVFATAGVHAGYKAWLARGATITSGGMKALTDAGGSFRPLGDSDILTPMRNAAGR